MSIDVKSAGASDNILAWLRTCPDPAGVHVRIQKTSRYPAEMRFQRTLIGMGCRITVQHRL